MAEHEEEKTRRIVPESTKFTVIGPFDGMLDSESEGGGWFSGDEAITRDTAASRNGATVARNTRTPHSSGACILLSMVIDFVSVLYADVVVGWRDTAFQGDHCVSMAGDVSVVDHKLILRTWQADIADAVRV